MATDPITLVHGGIWTMLEASSDFDAAVRDGNRIKFIGGTIGPRKEKLLAMDTPQVAVVPLGLRSQSEGSSSSSYVRSLWSIEVLGGTLKYETTANLEWIIWGQMLEWRTYLKDALTYNSRAFVHESRTLSLDDDLRNRRTMRVQTALQFPESWISAWVGYCDLNFITANYQS